jgi:guanylate kinase
MKRKGMLIVICGPAGCGKDTIVKDLFAKLEDCADCSGKDCELFYSVSTTTRSIRPGEVEGEHYFFKPRAEFESLIEQGEFLEYTEYCGNYYGTRNKTVLAALDEGKNIVLKIECVGAANIKQLYPDAVLIFILPPSFEELRRRIEGRSTEDAQTIERRLAKAQEEIALADKFDYRVVNDDLQTAIDDVARIICEEREKLGVRGKVNG